MSRKSVPCLLLMLCMLIFPQADSFISLFPGKMYFSKKAPGKPYRTAAKCTTPNNKLGKCIPLRNCRSIQSKLAFKETIPYIQAAGCGTASERFLQNKVCCQLKGDPFEGIHFQKPQSEPDLVTSTYGHPSASFAPPVFPQYGHPNTNPASTVFAPDVHYSTSPAPPVFPHYEHPNTSPAPPVLPHYEHPNTGPASTVFPPDVRPNTSPGAIVFPDYVRPNSSPAPEAFPHYVRPNASPVPTVFPNYKRHNTNPAPIVFPDYVRPNTTPVPTGFPYYERPNTNPAPIIFPDYVRPNTSPAPKVVPLNVGSNTSPGPIIFPDYVGLNTSPAPKAFPHDVRPNTRSVPIDSPDDVLPNNECGKQPMYNTGYNMQHGIGEFPWLALLVHRHYHRSRTLGCSGFLIHTNFVLTAAHCVQNHRLGRLEHIILGVHNNTHKVLCLDEFCRVKSVPKIVSTYPPIIHERYDDNLLTNDIALIPLKEEISFTGFIWPICLAETEGSSKFLISTGWDRTGEHTGSLRKLKDFVSKYDLGSCMKEINTYNNHKGFVTGSNICSVGTKNSCTGDTGGPLMSFNVNQRWYAEGIASFDTDCGKSNWRGVYTNIPSFYNWIVYNIQEQLVLDTDIDMDYHLR